MIYIDCGFYAGKALEYYAHFFDKDTTVYIFEPNPNIPVEAHIDRFPDLNIIWKKQAVWTEDGKAMFSTGEREDAARLTDVRKSPGEEVEVETIDFSKFVADLPDDKITVSMDIEGAEYPVLRKMLEEGTAQKITLLDIEFHDRLLTDEDPASSSLLRRTLEAEGILVKLKI